MKAQGGLGHVCIHATSMGRSSGTRVNDSGNTYDLRWSAEEDVKGTDPSRLCEGTAHLPALAISESDGMVCVAAGAFSMRSRCCEMPPSRFFGVVFAPPTLRAQRRFPLRLH